MPGLPVQDGFNIQSTDGVKNVVAESGETVSLTTYVADKHGNPVPEGTPVAFSTDRGIVSDNAQTNAEGQATASFTASGKAGLATITATTANSDEQKVSDQIEVMLSGTAQLTAGTSTVDLTNFSSQTIGYTVDDQNGHPLTAGTNVTVSVDNPNLTLSGDTDVTIPEATQSGQGTTEFSFTLSNPSGDPIYEDGTVTITTDGPNGSATEDIALNAPDAPDQTAGSITLSSVSNDEIGVVGTGQTEQSQLTFQVTDSTGQPLDANNAVDVNFRMGNAPAGAEVSPQTVTTNADGQATATVTSGTDAGVAQVIAQK
ncbi:MAG: Ig-like domain-containing protein [Fodinibius sp.]|nr:Ig-like domain-containing protein [Fodinibius sp.]